MSDTPITDKVRAAIKESWTSRTDRMRGERLALVELERLERELALEKSECERLNKWIDAMNNSAAIDASDHNIPALPEPVAYGPPFKFTRWVNGEERAEGVIVENRTTLDAAIRKAVEICPKRPNTVLVLQAPPAQSEPSAIPAGYVLVETQLIRDLIEKLIVYHKQTGGRYEGGVPCDQLTTRLSDMLAAAKEKE